MVQVYATHEELERSEDVPGMGIEYVYRFEYEEMKYRTDKEIAELRRRLAYSQEQLQKSRELLGEIRDMI